MSFPIFRANLEVHNKRRLEAAERLATEINHNNKGNKTRGEATPNSRRKTSINKRYQNTSSGKIPVIRETRSSVMRKTALIADVVRKDRSKIRQQTSKIKASDKSPKKPNNRLLEMSLQSTNTLLDQSFELVNSGAGSPRIQVHPDEFVTGKTYNRYQRHKSPLDRSLEATNWKKLVNRRTETPDDILPSTTYRSQPKQQERESGGRTANKEDLKTLLVSYGLEVDHGLFERNSETSKLLDEVDLALIEESGTMNSTTLTNQTVDWNEVDRILNE